MKEKILIEMIENMGLTNKEATLYFNLLKLKKATAYELGKNINSISNAYNILNSLQKKSLVTKVKIKNKTIYTAKRLEEFIAEKQDMSNIIFKNILSLYQKVNTGNDTNIKIWSDSKNTKEAILYGLSGLTDKKLYCVYPSRAKLSISPAESVYIFTNRYIHELGIKKIILSEKKVREEYTLADKEFGFERYTSDNKILEKISDAKTGFEIAENRFIKIYFYSEGLIICIENKNLANISLEILRGSY